MVFNDLWGEATCSHKSLILTWPGVMGFLHGKLGKLDITGVESGLHEDVRRTEGGEGGISESRIIHQKTRVLLKKKIHKNFPCGLSLLTRDKPAQGRSPRDCRARHSA